MSYGIVHFEDSQFQQCEDFLTSFKGGYYSSDSFISRDWWAINNPFRSYIVFAYTEKEIVSRCVITRRCIGYRDEVVDCYEIGGTCTLPQHQRKGLFTRLVKRAVDLGFGSGPRLIYGTPNNKSGPGYKKIGFSFIDKQDNFLVWLCNPLNALLRKLSLNRNPIQNTRILSSFESLPHSIKVTELTLEQYIQDTKNFVRMNYVDEKYLRYRLTVNKNNNRRFFHGFGRNGQFYCAVRDYELGFLRLLMLSEYFLDGHIDDTWEKASYARIIQRRFYKNADGIYFKGFVDSSRSLIFDTVLRRYIVHRRLPICYTYTGLPKERVEQMMSQLVQVFQLTDCDIG
jgi:GNAT superfamily N-acetyltransferase